MQFTVDREFAAVMPPLQPEEKLRLEESIVRDGCKSALLVWDGILVDGHHRFEICERLGVPYRTEGLQFGSRDEALAWSIQWHLGRRHLTTYARVTLALKMEGYFKAAGLKRKAHLVNSPKVNTRESIARLAAVGDSTVKEVKYIQENADEDTKKKLSRGDISINAAHEYTKSQHRPPEAQSAPAVVDYIEELSGLILKVLRMYHDRNHCTDRDVLDALKAAEQKYVGE